MDECPIGKELSESSAHDAWPSPNRRYPRHCHHGLLRVEDTEQGRQSTAVSGLRLHKWAATETISASTIMWTRSRNAIVGVHPNCLCALLASPRNSWTSAGR